MESKKKSTFLILLLSGFIDYLGIALVYPIFAYLLFSSEYSFLPEGTSEMVRGLWLGVLLALQPITLFLFSPIWGTLSDQRGRKKILCWTLLIGMGSYLFALVGVMEQSLLCLALFRLVGGIAAGNASIVSAVVADISTPEQKARRYGLLNMAFGAGFTLGPFLGGILAEIGVVTVFSIPLVIVAINYLLVLWMLPETHPKEAKEKLSLFAGFTQLRRAMQMTGMRAMLASLFVFTLGWTFFLEFGPVFLIDRFHFGPGEIGNYYGFTGLCYSLVAGLCIQPFVRRFGEGNTLIFAQIFGGVYLIGMLFIFNPAYLWFYLPLLQFFLAFIYPTTSALISNRVSEEQQGEVMGVYQAVIAIALAVCPLVAGFIIGAKPMLTVLIGGMLITGGGVIFLLFDPKSQPLESPELVVEEGDLSEEK